MQDKRKLVKAVAAGTICSMLCSVILTAALAAAIMSVGLLPDDILMWITVGIMLVSAFAGGFIAAKINKGAGIPVGGLTGLAVFCAAALSSFSRGESNVTVMILIKLAAAVFGSVAGGITGVREKRGSKYGKF
ncbi:MAG TPA: TIGR04086 family membrane protein [Ruminococcaceae bacterium]|nr:TIGR04086 family membrane protein [Oscillospiraceae bacterium]